MQQIMGLECGWCHYLFSRTTAQLADVSRGFTVVLEFLNKWDFWSWILQSLSFYKHGEWISTYELCFLSKWRNVEVVCWQPWICSKSFVDPSFTVSGLSNLRSSSSNFQSSNFVILGASQSTSLTRVGHWNRCLHFVEDFCWHPLAPQLFFSPSLMVLVSVLRSGNICSLISNFWCYNSWALGLLGQCLWQEWAIRNTFLESSAGILVRSKSFVNSSFMVLGSGILRS